MVARRTPDRDADAPTPSTPFLRVTGVPLRIISGRERGLGPLFVLAANTGMRLGEVLGLQWIDINLASKRLVVRRSLQRQKGKGLVFSEPKTGRSRRTIHLTDRAVAAVQLQLERQREERDLVGADFDDRGLVFSTPFGRPLDPGTTSNTFKRELVSAGLPPYKFHALRHTCATLLFEQGVNAKVISELLGHSTISITLDIYSHVTPTMHASAAPVMDAIFNRLEAA